MLIGVMPPGFAFPDRAELWTPMGYLGKPEQRGSHSFPGWARLKPGVTLDTARAEVATIAARLAREHPATNEGKTLSLRLVREEATEGVGLLMKLMLGAAICVLLIACANVANLLLARAASRSHEIAIRVSVGASRWQIVRQILVESLLLGVVGGTFGLLVAAWADSLLFSSVPEVEIPFWMTFEFDWRVFSFAAGAAIGSALLFGLSPPCRFPAPPPWCCARAAAPPPAARARARAPGPRRRPGRPLRRPAHRRRPLRPQLPQAQLRPPGV